MPFGPVTSTSILSAPLLNLALLSLLEPERTTTPFRRVALPKAALKDAEDAACFER